MAEATTRQTDERDWLGGEVPDEQLDHFLEHASELEHTDVAYLWPFLLGMLGGIAVPLGLLFASL